MSELVVGASRFHIQRLGSGPSTVVFLHGLVMDNLSSLYYTIAPAVARFADVLLFDLRGHGLSERPTSGYTVPILVGDVTGLLDELKIPGPVWLVGHSFGGLLALALSAAEGARVAGLVLLDPLVPRGPWQERMAGTLQLQGEERDREIGKSFGNWLGRHSERKTTRLARTGEALVNGTTLIEDLLASPSMTDDDLSAIGCPVLVVVGENSDVRDEGEVLGTLIPRCDFRVMPDCTHSVLWERTTEVRDEVSRWLEARVVGG